MRIKSKYTVTRTDTQQTFNKDIAVINVLFQTTRTSVDTVHAVSQIMTLCTVYTNIIKQSIITVRTRRSMSTVRRLNAVNTEKTINIVTTVSL